MNNFILLTIFFISISNVYANGRIGNCSYGVDPSGQLFLDGGEHRLSKSFSLGSGDWYRCSASDRLGLFKLNIPFAGEVSGFIHINIDNQSCNVREVYIYDHGRWVYDPDLAFIFSLQIGSQCNN
jgi:hypothetical protein